MFLLALFYEPINFWLAFYISMAYITVRRPIPYKTTSLKTTPFLGLHSLYRLYITSHSQIGKNLHVPCFFFNNRFAIGMLYQGLNTSSIQLLGNFYSNYAIRELVNLLAFACNLVLVTWYVLSRKQNRLKHILLSI
jgi:hypothetical protein